MTNAPAGRNGASSGDRRRRRGLRRVTAAGGRASRDVGKAAARARRGNDHGRKPDALAEALRMVIDDGLVNRLAHMRARTDRDLVDS